MGYAISLNLIHRPETDDVYGILNSLFARQVDGVIWAIPQVGSNLDWSHQRAPHLPVPVVLVGGMAGQASLPSIGIDNRAIGRLATEHLLAGGARHIGLITGPLSWWEAREREAGWRETIASSAFGDAAGPVFEGDWTAASGEEGLRHCLLPIPAWTLSSPATTRWPWACSTPPTRWDAGCPGTCPWSASTTWPRAPTSGRR